MKISITTDASRKIDGFTTIPVVMGSVKILDVPRNGCEYLELFNCIDDIKHENIVAEVCQKIRKDGVLSIVGTDLSAMVNGFVNKSMPKEEFVAYVTSKANLSSLEDIVNTIRSSGLRVISSKLNGIFYEVKATRQA